MMKRLLAATALAALALGLSACGGYGSPSPTSPDGSAAPPPGAVVIDIVGINDARSFAPNPATVSVGQTVVWHNLDTTTHRVALNDAGLVTGNIAPGAFSAPRTLTAPGPYHCSIHPQMVGTIVDGR